MRVYALLLGTLLTLGSGYLATMGPASASPDGAATLVCDAAHPGATDPIWYGGQLAPITVEARATATTTAITVTGAGANAR